MKRRRARVQRTRYAGRVGDAEYGVTTLISPPGDDHLYCRRPCAQCPWRSDLPTGVFPAEAYRHSAPTAYDMAPNIFACHMGKDTQPITCAGFLLRGSDHNFAIRMALIMRRIDYRQITDEGLPLYDSYRHMAESNGVDSEDPILGPCR